MLRIASALLILTFAVINVSEAMRTGRVQADLSPDNKRDRKQDPLAFWFFTLVWGAIALLFLAGISTVVASSVFGLGKPVPATFWHVTWHQWPWGIVAVGFLYLIVAKVGDRSENDA